MPSVRQQILVDVSGAPCQLCSGATSVMQTREVRRGLARLNPRWDPDIRVYEVCEACGAKRLVGERRPG